MSHISILKEFVADELTTYTALVNASTWLNEFDKGQYLGMRNAFQIVKILIDKIEELDNHEATMTTMLEKLKSIEEELSDSGELDS